MDEVLLFYLRPELAENAELVQLGDSRSDCNGSDLAMSGVCVVGLFGERDDPCQFHVGGYLQGQCPLIELEKDLVLDRVPQDVVVEIHVG